MSRSYKKNPFVTDHKRKVSKVAKRMANHSFRQQVAQDEDIPARTQYKKMTDSWNICDYKWRMTREEAIQWYNELVDRNPTAHFMKRFPTLEVWLNYWEKCYKRKQGSYNEPTYAQITQSGRVER